MIKVPAATLREAYPLPSSELEEVGFGSWLEAECFCGLIRRHVASVQRDELEMPALFEIGTFRGGGLVHIHAMLPELELQSLNVAPEHLAFLPSQQASEILPREEIGVLAREAGVSYVQHYADSRTFDWDKLGKRQRFDVVFIDGNHEQFTVMADTLNVLRILKPDGLIIWHDYKVTDEPGRQVFAALQDLDQHEFGGQIHHVEGTWLAYARWPVKLAKPGARVAMDGEKTAPSGGVPALPLSLDKAIAQHLAYERRVRLKEKLKHVPAEPLVVFFSDHRNPLWPGDDGMRGGGGGYRVSRDPTLITEANIVVFHLPDTPAWVMLPRRWNQLWVGVTMESDEYCPWQADPRLVDKLDLLMSYHAHADVKLNYSWPGTLAEALKPTPPKSADKLVCALISNTRPMSKRDKLIEKLEKLLPVHHFGRWHYNQEGERREGREAKLDILRQYQFCLAFENTLQEDYLTEKWYDCFQAGCVPVYYGAPNADAYAPSEDAYIHVTPASSIKALAETIRATQWGTAAYARYFDWKQQPRRSFCELYENRWHRMSLLEQIDDAIKHVI